MLQSLPHGTRHSRSAIGGTVRYGPAFSFGHYLSITSAICGCLIGACLSEPRGARTSVCAPLFVGRPCILSGGVTLSIGALRLAKAPEAPKAFNRQNGAFRVDAAAVGYPAVVSPGIRVVCS